METTEMVVGALTALRSGDHAGALRGAKRADGSVLGRELVEHLTTATDTERRVYDQPAAFTAFVRGGGNVQLYQRLSERLAEAYDALKPQNLIDFGCGDGLALAPALDLATHIPVRLDLVEPSAALLDTATARLNGVTDVHAWPLTAQDFFAQLTDGTRWQLAQATFSLQSVLPEDRPAVLSALRTHVDSVTIAEFDIPTLTEGSVEGGDEHLRSLVTRYERGIAEYGDDAHLVAQGFLLPVLLGQVAPTGGRTNWEVPVETWAQQLTDAGFTTVATTPLADYWWSPAVLITAS